METSNWPPQKFQCFGSPKPYNKYLIQRHFDTGGIKSTYELGRMHFIVRGIVSIAQPISDETGKG